MPHDFFQPGRVVSSGRFTLPESRPWGCVLWFLAAGLRLRRGRGRLLVEGEVVGAPAFGRAQAAARAQGIDVRRIDTGWELRGPAVPDELWARLRPPDLGGALVARHVAPERLVLKERPALLGVDRAPGDREAFLVLGRASYSRLGRDSRGLWIWQDGAVFPVPVDLGFPEAGAVVSGELTRTACGWGLVEDRAWLDLVDWVRAELHSLAVSLSGRTLSGSARSLAAPILESLEPGRS